MRGTIASAFIDLPVRDNWTMFHSWRVFDRRHSPCKASRNYSPLFCTLVAHLGLRLLVDKATHGELAF